MIDETHVRARLDPTDLPELLVRLGFHDDDAVDAVATAAAVLAVPEDVAVIARCAELLAQGVGKYRPDEAPDPWEHLPEGREDLAILALLAAVDAPRAEHRRRGIPDDVSWGSLADLGQQISVHRLTHGRFGLDTYGWMRTAWSAGLIWLGRLQMQPRPTTSGWVLDVHIPATGPLTPEAVDASFAAGVPFFRRHFPEYPPTAFVCSSWLLDPLLAELLPGSNLAAFQQRWTLADDGHEADEAVVYFVFKRRSPVDLGSLPRRTTLERAVLDHLDAGRHWRVYSGTAPLGSDLPGAAEDAVG